MDKKSRKESQHPDDADSGDDHRTCPFGFRSHGWYGSTILTNQDPLIACDQLRSFLYRKDVQSQLTARGIDPAEAQARIDSLSDAEVMQIADKIDQLPAGGSFWATVLYLAIIAFIVLVVLELLGYTDFV